MLNNSADCYYLKIVINFCPIVKLILRTVNLQRTMSIYFEVCQTKLQIVQNKLKKGVLSKKCLDKDIECSHSGEKNRNIF